MEISEEDRKDQPTEDLIEEIRKEIIKRGTTRIMNSGDQIEENKKTTIEDVRGVDSLEVLTKAIIVIVGQIIREVIIEGRIKGLEKEIIREMEAISRETIERRVMQEVMVEMLGLMIELTQVTIIQEATEETKIKGNNAIYFILLAELIINALKIEERPVDKIKDLMKGMMKLKGIMGYESIIFEI